MELPHPGSLNPLHTEPELPASESEAPHDDKADSRASTGLAETNQDGACETGVIHTCQTAPKALCSVDSCLRKTLLREEGC